MGLRKQKLKWDFWSYSICLLAGNEGNITGGWELVASLYVVTRWLLKPSLQVSQDRMQAEANVLVCVVNGRSVQYHRCLRISGQIAIINTMKSDDCCWGSWRIRERQEEADGNYLFKTKSGRQKASLVSYKKCTCPVAGWQKRLKTRLKN